jgi:hypothetical protein
VADVVVTLRHGCTGTRQQLMPDRCGLPAISADGELIGEIDDLLIDAIDDSILRYVVVGHGGILGIARRRVAIPSDFAQFEAEQVRLRLNRDDLHNAPSFDEATPFSRKDELAVNQYFGNRPYWLTTAE